MDMTKAYNAVEFNDGFVLEILRDVYVLLEERGYNPTNQVVGYLISGDPGYITSYKGARTLITGIERTQILEVILKKALL
ncbi:MAG: IreB family regulatory phosphoprotein [Bacilli bacterium]